jgi:hypothetical protein
VFVPCLNTSGIDATGKISFLHSRPLSSTPGPGRRAPSRPRIVRIPIFHEGTFHAILRAALRAGNCLRRGGAYWEPFQVGPRFGLYYRCRYDLAWIQHRVADYEFFFYSRLLLGHCASDGSLRPRSRLRRGPGGAYRRCEEAERR